MSKYVKNKKEYESVEFDAEAIEKAYANRKQKKKFPTSINLPEETITDLKAMAQKKGVPYQTLMRMLIIEGLDNLKKAS